MFDRICACSKREPQFLLSVASCVFCVDLIATDGLWTVIYCSLEVSVWQVFLSVTNLVYYWSPNGRKHSPSFSILCQWLVTVDIPKCVSSYRLPYWLCSGNGFPISSIILTSALTSFANADDTPDCWSCWRRVPNVTSTVPLRCSLFPILWNCLANFFPSWTFHMCTVLSRGIVKFHERDLVVCCVHQTFSGREFRMFCSKCRHVLDVYRKPFGVA